MLRCVPWPCHAHAHARQLLRSPDLNLEVDVEKADGSTPLLLAATMGHVDVVRVLLEVSVV